MKIESDVRYAAIRLLNAELRGDPTNILEAYERKHLTPAQNEQLDEVLEECGRSAYILVDAVIDHVEAGYDPNLMRVTGLANGRVLVHFPSTWDRKTVLRKLGLKDPDQTE